MERIGDMPVLFLSVFRFVRLLLSGHQAIAVENAALRIQIAAFQRKRKRPLLTTLDRVFWISLRSLCCVLDGDGLISAKEQSDEIDRFLYRADHHDEDPVRVYRAGTRSSQGAAL